MRGLLWLVGSAGLCVGCIWLMYRPQTWLMLSRVAAVVNVGANAAYGLTAYWEETRRERRVTERPLPSADAVLDAIDHFLHEPKETK